MKKILFTGGGSAGHVVPNIALMEELLSSGEADVCYIGTDGIEKRLVSEWKIPYYQIECPKLIRGGGFAGFKRNLQIPIAFARAMKQAEKGLRAFAPDAVFSKGGYVALPVVVASKKLKIPCFAHESDYSVGLANKLSARFCKRVFTSFPETAKKIKRGAYSGAPLRRAVLASTRAEARKRLNIAFHETVVFVFGGGSGSETLNHAVRKHLHALTKKYVVLHVCGKGNLLNETHENYRQYEYVSDIGDYYASADVIVSRAGAGAVFEILALKKRAVFVPLEGQTRGDQVENANYFAQKGLCKVLRQTELKKLPDAIADALADKTMQENLLSSSFTGGNQRILSELRLALGGKR